MMATFFSVGDTNSLFLLLVKKLCRNTFPRNFRVCVISTLRNSEHNEKHKRKMYTRSFNNKGA